MPGGPKDIKIKEVEAKSDQRGVWNQEVSGNSVETRVEFIHLHLNSAMSVLVVILLMFALCMCWRFLKRKNLEKFARFVCLNRCRVTREMLEVESQVPRTQNRQATSENELVDVNSLIALCNRTTLENSKM